MSQERVSLGDFVAQDDQPWWDPQRRPCRHPNWQQRVPHRGSWGSKACEDGRVGTGRLCSAQGWSQHRDEEAECQAPSPQCVILKDATRSFRPEGTIADVQGWDLAVTADVVQRKHRT